MKMQTPSINTGEDTGEIPSTPAFKLMGSTLACNMKDESEVELRIKSAQGAFSAIRTQFFSAKGIKNSHKKTAYKGLNLSCKAVNLAAWQSCSSTVCNSFITGV